MASRDEIDDRRIQAFQEEQQKLDAVVQYITDERIRLQQGMPARAAHQEAADAIQKILEGNADNLYSALDQPYFGRLDYFTSVHSDSGTPPDWADDEPLLPNTIYLGRTSIPGQPVYSWVAPIGRLWYTQSAEDGYTAPIGYIPTRVDLKRYLRIRQSQIEDITDIYRRQLPPPDTTRTGLLTEALSGTGAEDGTLQVIVETIEPEQYEAIANVDDKVLIVQGAAGSGKSEIGMHRIAFLLSPFNEIEAAERPTPATTLFVGPSTAFLEYTSDILPELGVREKVNQTRFTDWIRERLSERIRIHPRIWDNLLAPGDTLRFNEQAEAFKGTLLMADAIDRRVGQIVNEVRSNFRILSRQDDLRDPDSGGSVSVSSIISALNVVLPRTGQVDRLNKRREDFINRLTGLVWADAQNRRRARSEEVAQERRRIRNDVVVPWCDFLWKHVDFRDEYVAMLSDMESMGPLVKWHTHIRRCRCPRPVGPERP